MRSWLLPACRGGSGARFHGPRPRLAGAVPPYGLFSWRRRAEAGGEYGDLGFPGDGRLGAGGVGNFGRAFCARPEWRCRLGTLRVCRHARAAASAAAASASSDEVAVTCVDVMDRIM